MKKDTISEITEEKKEFNRQHRSVQVLSKKGEVESDQVLKQGEAIQIYNIKQRKAFKKKMETKKAIEDLKKHMENNGGDDFVHFMFSFLQPAFIRLEERCGGNKANTHIIRFIKLSVHLNFKNNLYDEHKNRIKKGNLGSVWDTKNNRKSVYETYNILKEEGFIYETEEGYIMINTDIVKKGKMDDYEKIMDKEWEKSYIRLFSKNIHHMYKDTNPRNRKQLANLFKIIPYINFRYNIFCDNPFETDNEKIIPYTWTDLARKCGYEDNKQISRFKKDLFNLSIGGYDVIGEFKTKSGYKIVINPKIYYAGSSVEDIEALYALFNMPIA